MNKKDKSKQQNDGVSNKKKAIKEASNKINRQYKKSFDRLSKE